MPIVQICFFVVFGLFHIGAFRIREKMFDQKKKVGRNRLFFILYSERTKLLYSLIYLPAECS